MAVDWTQIVVIGIPATVAAFGSLRNGHKLASTDKKLETLDRNGGNSMRDDIDKIVLGLKITADHLAVQDRALASIGESVDALKGDGRQVKEKIAHVEGRIEADEVKMARYIVHEANNTLHLSALLEEEKRLLEETEKKP